MRIGSLFSGFGGLDLAVERVFSATTAWVADIEPGPCKVLAHRFPDAPTKPGRNGRPKLNPDFACWMMGCSPGWVTDVPGVTDNEALRMAGNGVVQQQAEAALLHMLNRAAVAA